MSYTLRAALQEHADFEEAVLRASRKSAADIPAAISGWPLHLKTFDDFVADELATIQAERAKDQARREHAARLARAREQGIREAGRAGLRPLEHADARREEAAPSKAKRETQADRVERWLTECEHRAAEQGEAFSRQRMPGTKAEFLDLLHALDADLRSIKTVESLDRYLKGYQWVGGRQPSALPLYARLFPEARIRIPGAIPAQRRKA